jgi:hypothetical protein
MGKIVSPHGRLYRVHCTAKATVVYAVNELEFALAALLALIPLHRLHCLIRWGLEKRMVAAELVEERTDEAKKDECWVGRGSSSR